MLALALILLLTPAQAWGSPSAEEFAIEDVHHKDWAPPTKQPRATPRLLRVVNGAASWYGPGFYGRQTASGERLRKGTFTAAHRTLPFGTRVRVTNLDNNRSVVVRINDRGPFRYHRVIDLAHGAARELRMMRAGEIPVRLEILP